MRASGYERADADWYVEPEWTVDALVDAEEPFQGLVWDPCCGGGTIPRRLIARGVRASGSDLVDRGYGLGGMDFFSTASAAASIVSNPPYGRAQDFIDRALALTSDRVCVLLRLAWLEGQARRSWHQARPLARVWVSSRRISMPPGGTNVAASGGTIPYAWFTYQHGYSGKPEIGWI